MESSPIHSRGEHAPASTVLRIEGADALDVLHRITTQSLRDLVPGEARTTLFCDYRGRLLHRASVAVTRDGAVWLVRDDAAGDELRASLERSVFREDVRITDLGNAWAARGVPRGLGLPPGSVREADGCLEAIQAGASFGLVIGSSTTTREAPDEHTRILEGRPRHGHEIAVEFNPYEVGLAHEVHLSKGCYTGQEALLRLMTYRGVRRRLVRLTGDGAPPAAPETVTLEGKAVGRLTSAVAHEGGWLALATLTAPASEAGATLRVAQVPATLAGLVPHTVPMGLA